MTILDFSVTNMGPFRDTATLSMQATGSKSLEDNVMPCGASGYEVLSSAMVFGANGYGKTYLVNAIRALASLMHPREEGREFRFYEPFRLSKAHADAPTDLRMRMISDGTLYDYAVSFDRDSVTSESLHRYPNGRRARVFVRKGGEFVGARKAVVESTTSATPYLAMAARFNDPVCAPVLKAIQGITVVTRDGEDLAYESYDYIARHPEYKGYMLKGLEIADFGISDIFCDDVTCNTVDRVDRPPMEMFLTHGSCASDTEDGRRFPFEIESAGTKAMVGLMGPLVDALVNGKVLVVDEFGSKLHPFITRWVIDQFSGGNNPNRAQLVANTNDISLIGDTDLLGRDQIWFVNKDGGDGASELYSLSDFKGLRRNQDLLRAYSSGRFEAMPFVRNRGMLRWAGAEVARQRPGTSSDTCS